MTELFTIYDTKDIKITNNHRYFIKTLKNKYRLFTYISVDSLKQDTEYVNPYSEITIIKSTLISTTDISIFFMWHLDIIINYFLKHNIDISYHNLKIYKEYIHKYGYSNDYEIYKLNNKIQSMSHCNNEENEIIIDNSFKNELLIIENLNLNKLKNDVLKSLILCEY